MHSCGSGMREDRYRDSGNEEEDGQRSHWGPNGGDVTLISEVEVEGGHSRVAVQRPATPNAQYKLEEFPC